MDKEEMRLRSPVMKVGAVAEYVQLGVRTIWAHVARGKFPKPIAMGRAKRWLKSDLDAWLDAQHQKGGQNP